MKKYISIIVLALLAMVEGFAQNVVTVSSAQGREGEVVTVDVTLTNNDPVSGLEILIPLTPKQLNYVDGSAVLVAERTDGHMLNAAVVDNTLRIYVYSMSLKELKGNEGKLLSFDLKLGKQPAHYSLSPQVTLGSANGNAFPVEVNGGVVTMLAPQIEIVTKNLDYGHVPVRGTYSAYMELCNTGTEPLEVSALQFSASEFSATETAFTLAENESKVVTVEYSPVAKGAVNESVTVVSNAINGNAVASLVADPYMVNELQVVGADGVSFSEVTVQLVMDNMEPIAGMQVDFELPEAVEYVEGSFAATERAAKHTPTSTLKNGALSLLLFSTSNATIDAGSGTVATFRLRLVGNEGMFYINPSKVILGDADAVNVVSAYNGGYVTIQIPQMVGNEFMEIEEASIFEVAKGVYSFYNYGNAPLEINGAVFLAEGFKVTDKLPMVVEPYGNGCINVEYTPVQSGEYSTIMKLSTNDPNCRVKDVNIKGYIYEPNVLTLDGENLQDGNYMVSVGLDNYTAIVALQMDIHFIPGMRTSNDKLKVTQRLAGHSCSLTKIDEDTYRIIAFSLSNSAIAGNEGKLFDITFVPDEGVEYKNAPITIDNVVLSSSSANNNNSLQTINGKATFCNFYVRFVCEGEVVSESFQRAGTAIVQPTMPEREGYTFSGWDGVPELSPEEDVVYTGEYKANEYKVDYLVDGVLFATDSLTYGSDIVLRDEPAAREGHTFSGWSEAPATMPAHDITIEGSFIVNSYAIIYKVDGDVWAVDSVAYSSDIVLRDEPVKEGYTFSGWSEAPAIMPANDVTIEGSFTVNSYAITYKVDGEVFATDSLTYGSEIVLRDEPVKEGHTFCGWSEAPATMPAHDITIEGSFTINSYTVTYLVDGEEYASYTVEYGAAVPIPEVQAKEGYTFNWLNEIPATMPANDVTIEGSFTINSYAITYKVDGDVWAVDSVAYSSDIVLRDEPVKEGYTFSGWSEAPATMPAHDITIEGSFTINSYTVTYLVDGEEYASYTVEYGAAVPVPEEPVKEGHTFSGWSEAPATMPAHDITIEGSFTVNSYTVTYLVDGEEYASYTVEYGAAVPVPEEPVKEGHTFSGWSEAPATMPAHDITIEGSFTINSYTVTYLVDGEEYVSYTVEYGAAVPVPEVQAKEGYTFNWLNEIPATMPAHDITIEGSFTINSYTVTYLVDGEEYASYTVEYGAAVPAPEEPVKEGHTFSGWSEAPATMPAHDITIEGSFTINSYTVTYLVDGEEYASYTVEYGAAIPVPENPTKEGYIFEGWTAIPDTMPAEDIVIEAIFIVDTGIISLHDGKPKDIYSLSGVLMIQQATYEDIMRLPQGTYIIDGKKVYIKH